MGGTFDPIHYGHLAAAEAVRQGFDLDTVVFIPAALPPHKQASQVTDASHRYIMTILATLSNEFFKVSPIELERRGSSYTIDTVRELRAVYGDETQLFFITGIDAILEICSWRDSGTLLTLCEFIAVTRPGYVTAGLNKLREALGESLFSRIHVFSVPALAISSSELRERVRKGKSIKYLVPEQVEGYILKNRLYLATDKKAEC